MLRSKLVVDRQRETWRKVRLGGTFVTSPCCRFGKSDLPLTMQGTVMDERKRPEPEIVPPVPKTEPRRDSVEVPPDKDAPEKQSPSAEER